VFMTRSLNVTPETTEQNLVVRIGKSETEVANINNKRLRSRYCTVEACLSKLQLDKVGAFFSETV